MKALAKLKLFIKERVILMTIKNVVVAGGGVLGSQIAYQTALKNFKVTLYDISDESITRSKKRVDSLFSDYQADTGLTKEEFNAGLKNLIFSSNLSDATQNADLVIEAIPEKLEIKQAFYQQLSQVAPNKTIFASNSSTLTPSMMVKGVNRPAKFANLHFANRIWLFNTAEIMGTPQTAPDTIETLTKFARAIGMVPIILNKEQPGYVLNSLLVPFEIAALKLWATGVADASTIDKDWIISTGAKMGPMATMDIIGLRTPYYVGLEYLKTHNDPVSELTMQKMKEMIDAGHSGKDDGQGFYHYPNPEYLDPDFLK